VLVIGDRENLARDIKLLLEEAEVLTEANTSMNLVIAFNYGARDEIARAARKLVRAAREGRLAPDQVTPETFEAFLDTAAMPDPDLVIRTSGEQRLSNFLLWQTAYSELVFMPCYWPDFDRRKLVEAIEIFSARDRRFGGVTPQDVAL
jgi:undecaprenyl diphosphate synthase